jgi:pyruvate dehydrogenase E2 component (dihydrolipoamide acetyltransferase)
LVFELKFADIGEGVHEGEILKWHVKPGDTVQAEQIVVEVMTEKVNVEITAPVNGKITSLGKEEGEIITVGEVLISIEESGSGKGKTPPKVEQTKPSQPAEKDDSLFTPSQPFQYVQPKKSAEKTIINEKPLAPPAVRKKARDLGIDLKTVRGSGPAGRINHQDLENYLKGSTTSVQQARTLTSIKSYVSGGEERMPLRGMRRAISQGMRRSKDHAAHYTYVEEVDMSALTQLRSQTKALAEQKGVKLTFLPFIIKAIIAALKKYPLLNSSLDEEKQEIVLKRYYNMGIAVATDEGLIVPVVKSADQKDIWELAGEIQDLSARARQGKLKLEDMQGSTFTITSIGSIGGLIATPIINYPEVAILGIMASKLKPVVVEANGKNEIVIRPIMNICLSLDHRVVDGAVGALFTNEIIKYLENPALVFIDT